MFRSESWEENCYNKTNDYTFENKSYFNYFCNRDFKVKK